MLLDKGAATARLATLADRTPGLGSGKRDAAPECRGHADAGPGRGLPSDAGCYTGFSR